MAKNTGKEYRQGAVIDRSQVYNPVTKQYVKIDTNTGKFLSNKDTQYKGIKLIKK